VNPADTITVEFYGMPRLLAGRQELAVPTLSPTSLSVVLAVVERTCPGLKGLVQKGGRLAPQYLLSRDGQEFVTDLSRELTPGTRLLLLSADAGG
jgi:hypothetical protein